MQRYSHLWQRIAASALHSKATVTVSLLLLHNCVGSRQKGKILFSAYFLREMQDGLRLFHERITETQGNA